MKIKIIILGIFILCQSCKKDNGDLGGYEYPFKKGSESELILDSIFMYTNEVWLWNTSLPKYKSFQPRRFLTYSDNPYLSLLYELVQFKKNLKTGLPYEKSNNHIAIPKYSNIVNIHNLQSENLTGLGSNGMGFDFGFEVLCISECDCRIAYVNQGSPAFYKGIKRGYKLIMVNNIKVSESNFRNIELIMQSSLLHLKVVDNNMDTLDVSLERKEYESTGIYSSKIISHNNKVTGYLAHGDFVMSSRAINSIDSIFNIFSKNNVSNIVIDFRYNSGGNISIAEQIINLLIPAGHEGKTMYTAHYNDLMKNRKSTILKNQYYNDLNGKPIFISGRRATYLDIDFSITGNTTKIQKRGNINNLTKIYFIVSKNTASAAELVINALKPYVDVYLIGDKTYGKPVGSFEIKINNYILNLASFQIKNANNEGDYFDGFNPNIFTMDDLRYDFGDKQEQSLLIALKMIEGLNLEQKNISNIKNLHNQNNNKILKRPQPFLKNHLKLEHE